MNKRGLLVFSMSLFFTGCGGTTEPKDASNQAGSSSEDDGAEKDGAADGQNSADSDAAASAERPQRFDAQVKLGMELYGLHCAKCHGDSGQGTGQAPKVVGPGALGRFRTALDVFTFASKNMPGDSPGSLPDEQMVDILAFALFANGVELDEPLGFENAEEVVLNSD